MRKKWVIGKRSSFCAVLWCMCSSSVFPGEIAFHANEGSGEMPPISQEENTYVTLPENTFTKIGYSFSGWNTEADGSGIDYANTRRFFMGSSDLSLFAEWKKSSEKIDTVGEELIMEFVSPAKGLPGTTYVEDYATVVRAKHPDGVAKVQINKPASKIGKPEPPFRLYDEDLGLFLTKRRYKGGSNLKYAIIIQTQKGEVIDSSEIYGERGWYSDLSFEPEIAQQQYFLNVKDGDTVKANQPLVLAAHCSDPDGSINGRKKGHNYPIDDLNGILSVALKVNGQEIETRRNAPENIAANETAVETFGLYKFMGVELGKGQHTLTIESVDRKGNKPEITSIKVTAQ